MVGFMRRGAGVFNALEINTSFYRIPEEGVVDRWRQRTPRPDFLYTAKAHRVRAEASIERICDQVSDALAGSVSPPISQTCLSGG